MNRIELVRYMPCPNCQWHDEIELSYELLDPDVVFYVLEMVTDYWKDFPDRNRWDKMLNKISERHRKNGWVPGFFRLFEHIYYCPSCKSLQKRIDWSLCCIEGEYCSRKHKCSCGVILQKIEKPQEFNNIIINCPSCSAPLPIIIVKEEIDYFEEKETICYPGGYFNFSELCRTETDCDSR